MQESNKNELYISNITEEIEYRNEYEFLLSIVVPVFNVEKYVGKCLESLINQNLESYEIIVVNDGCTDNSQKIIDLYKEKYPKKIKSFIKKNGGLSDARNYGLEKAKGKYIAFIDSDDYAEKDYYYEICKFAEENKLDLAVSDLQYEWEDESRLPLLKKGLSDVKAEINRRLFLSPLFAWNKLYRKELFDCLNCRYPLNLWYEDVPVSLKFFSYAKRIGYYRNVGIHYLQRSSSILGTKYSEKMYDIFRIFELVIEEFKSNNKFATFRNEIEYLYIEHFLVYGAFRFLRTAHYKELMKNAFYFVQNTFPDYKKNPYIYTLGKKNIFFLWTDNNLTMGLWHWYLMK